jgi:hypothetical protein
MISDARYNRGKVYKIVSPSTDLVYIGSTIQPLHKRLCAHLTNYKQFLKGSYRKITSFEIMKYGDAEIYLIELCDCQSKMELERCERSHIESIECVNKQIPGRTLKEYYIDNRDKFKQYYIDNKEKNKQYYIDNPEIKKQYYIDNRDKFKQYYIDNKEKISEQKKQYHIDNQDKIKQYYVDNQDKKKKQSKQYYIDNKDKNKITCDICNKLTNKYYLKQHQKTQSCKSYICIFLDE